MEASTIAAIAFFGALGCWAAAGVISARARQKIQDPLERATAKAPPAALKMIGFAAILGITSASAACVAATSEEPLSILVQNDGATTARIRVDLDGGHWCTVELAAGKWLGELCKSDIAGDGSMHSIEVIALYADASRTTVSGAFRGDGPGFSATVTEFGVQFFDLD